jgi:hypothetical protein
VPSLRPRGVSKTEEDVRVAEHGCDQRPRSLGYPLSGRLANRNYRLLGPDGFYWSNHPGTLGGHTREKVYGRLDCPVALSLIRRGRAKVEYPVFFRDAEAASVVVIDRRPG